MASGGKAAADQNSTFDTDNPALDVTERGGYVQTPTTEGRCNDGIRWRRAGQGKAAKGGVVGNTSSDEFLFIKKKGGGGDLGEGVDTLERLEGRGRGCGK